MVLRTVNQGSLAALCFVSALLGACRAQPPRDCHTSREPSGPAPAVARPAVTTWRDVKGADYEGVVVPESAPVAVLWDHQRRWSPENWQIARAEVLLRAALAADRQARHIPEKLHRYFRQYTGFLEGSERRILIDAFCEHHEELRRATIVVADGGDCFFHATYDVEKDAILDVSVNGSA